MEIRIRNFRSLKSIDVPLAPLTVLIGANNSGKTSFLEALFAAMGSGRRALSADDIYIGANELKPPFDRSIFVDVLIRPTDTKGDICGSFDEGSYWLNLWRNGIAQDQDDNDFMAFRTRLTWKPESGDYSVERQFLREWVLDSTNIENIESKSEAGFISAKQLEPMALYFMDAKRDIEDDMRHPGSFWRRMTNDLGLSETDIEFFEANLTEVNEGIVAKSEVLRHIKSTLGDLHGILRGEQQGVELAPVARKLRDLTKGIDVNFATQGAQTFPLVRHGMGTRSMASILIFRAFMKWRSLKSKSTGDEVHPMLALEEPEAHLHPQAQRALFAQIADIPGQVIISSHSPYVVVHANFGDLRHFQKDGADTTVSRMDLGGLEPSDLLKMKWKVLNTRGDILFANHLVLFEGETEEQAFSIYAEEYWNMNPNELGIAFIGVGGAGSYLPFLRLAKGFGIDWYIFSDAETNPLGNMCKALKQIGIEDYKACPKVIALPMGSNLEDYLVSSGYAKVIETVLNRYHGSDNHVQDYIENMNEQKMKGGKPRNYRADSDGGKKRALLDILKEGKTIHSEAIAHEIVSLPDKNLRIPSRIRDLFDQISTASGIVARRNKENKTVS